MRSQQALIDADALTTNAMFEMTPHRWSETEPACIVCYLKMKTVREKSTKTCVILFNQT